VVPMPAKEPPAAPRGLLTSSKRDWTAFWASDVATIVQDSDLPALERLWLLRDERKRFARVFRDSPFVAGSKGQQRLNPAASWIATLDPEIRALEDRFGLSPLGRSRLGLTFSQAALTLADLHADPDDEGDEPDPRLDDDPEERAMREEWGPPDA
jgi:hypothetical protein